MNLLNHDGTFFNVTSPDLDLNAVASEDVISLEVTEEMSKMDSGTVRLLDRNHIYSRLIRPGSTVKVSWGIRPVVGVPSQRSGVEFMVNSPSGSGDSGGQVTFNCSFMSAGFRGVEGVVWYESGTKADVVAEVMTKMGIPPSNQKISFLREKERITGGTKVAQYESDFRFLVRLADEWRCAFRVGYDQKGLPVGCFVDYDLTQYISLAIGGRSSMFLEYGSDPNMANVLSYSWRDNSMDAAQGQGARVVMVDGKPQIFRTVVENETVKTYRLVPERIEAELATRDLAGRTSLLAEYLSAKDFKSVERFFVEDTVTTAPQGSGIEVDVDMMGDPYVTAGMVVSFGYGFPDRVGSTDRTWWVRKVTHKIDRSGYFLSVSIADAYSFSPTGTKLAPVGGSS